MQSVLTIRSALASDMKALTSKAFPLGFGLLIPRALLEASATVPTPSPAARLPKEKSRPILDEGTALCRAFSLSCNQKFKRTLIGLILYYPYRCFDFRFCFWGWNHGPSLDLFGWSFDRILSWHDWSWRWWWTDCLCRGEISWGCNFGLMALALGLFDCFLERGKWILCCFEWRFSFQWVTCV